MSYAASYALFNYTVEDPAKGLNEYSNLRLIRSFERGLDPKSSEAGFILTHVDMVKETGPLIAGALKVVDSLEQRGSRQEVNDGFREILKSMEKIEASMEGMIFHQHYSSWGAVRLHINHYLDRHVGQLEAIRISLIPRLHLRYHQPIHVPQWCHLRRL